MTRTRVVARLGLAFGLSWALGCTTAPADPPAEAANPVAPAVSDAPDCPAQPLHVSTSPGVEAKHLELDYWLAKLPEGEADRPLLEANEVAAINARAAEIDGAWRDPLDPSLAEPERVRAQLEERVEWMRGQVVSGNYHESEAGDFQRAVEITQAAQPVERYVAVVEESDLRCMPLSASLFKEPADPDFDRNNCASLHAGEWLRVLASHEADGTRWDYVHAGHSVGWLRDAKLTPSLPLEEARKLRDGPSYAVRRDETKTAGGRSFRMGVSLPREGAGVLVPTLEGFVPDTLVDAQADADAPTTRRSLWAAAFSELDSPYGWGGRAGERDCSRLLRDVFVPSGVQLARHSAVQAKVGSQVIDVSQLEEVAKRARIEEAAAQGAVLLYMPGHIMLYLGEDGPQQYAISSISEYLTPCEGGPDTVNRIDRVAVTTLALGRGTKKRAFIERITTLVVFGAKDSGVAGGVEAERPD